MNQAIIPTGEATAILPVGERHSPVRVFGTESIRRTFDDLCLQQAINSRCAPGVTDLVLNPRCTLRLRRTDRLRFGITDPYLSGSGWV